MTKAAELAKIVDASGNIVTSGTVEPAGDTAAGDNAAIGFTSAEGIVITGQGSTNDVTIKNDADADVIEIPTGTTNVTVAGTLTATGFIIGSADINENDLESIDGITAGTVAASKAAIVDTNKDITGFRNITLTGELDAATLDISGNADIDGTLEADAMTLNGTAITATATLDTGISNNNVPKFTSGVADDDFLRVSGTAIEGRSASEVLSDIGASAVAGSSSIVTTGALNAGSITSGFGTIDTGSSNITSTGVGAFGSLDISGDIDVDGTTNLDVVDIDGAVDMASTLTVTGVSILNGGVDIAGDLTVDVDGGDIFFKDSGTEFGRITNSGGMFGLQVATQDQDLIVYMNDGGSTVEALKLDGSDAGTAIFNHDVKITSGNIQFGASGSETGQIEINSTRLLLRSTGDASGLRFDGASYTPFKNGSQANGTVDIGSSGARYKDLYLSSGVFLGGTGSANELTDYEEGTWTPALVGLSNTPSFHNNSGRYTKIGRVCTAQFFQQTNVNPTFSTGTDAFKISGLPFAVDGSGYTGSQGSVSAQALNYHGSNNNQSVSGGGSNGGAYLTASVNTSEQMQFQVTNSGGSRGEVNNNGAAQGYIIEATVTYFTSD